MDFERFLDLSRALASEWVDYVLEGRVALNLHGIVRATEVVDLRARLGSAFAFDDLETQTVMVEGAPRGWRRPRRSIA